MATRTRTAPEARVTKLDLERRVRRAVRAVLAQSPSFAALPAPDQHAVSADVEKLVRYLARPRRGPTRQATPRVARKLPIRRLPREADELVSNVNFPEFVSGLIEGVFQAIVNATIQQMEAYAQLVRQAAESVDEFERDNVPPDEGRERLASQYPGLFCDDDK